MGKISNIVISLVTASVFAGATWTLPARGAGHQSRGKGQEANQMLSVSGKITSVETDSFMLQTSESNPGQRYQQSAQGRGKALTFLIDQNTTVDGTLQVGASADVAYRQENGSNIAVNIHVSPQS